MKCKKCNTDVNFSEWIMQSNFCKSCYKQEKNIDKAKQILKENVISFKGGLSNINHYSVVDVSFGYMIGEKWLVKEDELVNSLIKNKFNLNMSIDELIKYHERKAEEAKLENEMKKIKNREERSLLREKAEKKLYGEIKKKRLTFTEDEKETMLNKFDNKCAVCGATEGLHIHHKDKNPKNNKPNNLTVLCGVCHKKIHMKVR